MQYTSLKAVFVIFLAACSAKEPAASTPLETEASAARPRSGETKPGDRGVPDTLPGVPRSDISSSSSKADMLAFGIAEFGWSDELLDALEGMYRAELWRHLLEEAEIQDWNDDLDFGYVEDYE